MGIKIKSVDRNSTLAKYRIPFGPGSTASSVSSTLNLTVICPVKAVLKKVVYTTITGISACAGDACHIIIANKARGSSTIDNTLTGTCAGVAAYAIVIATATAIVPVTANTPFSIMVSQSLVAQEVAGYLEFDISTDQR